MLMWEWDTTSAAWQHKVVKRCHSDNSDIDDFLVDKVVSKRCHSDNSDIDDFLVVKVVS